MCQKVNGKIEAIVGRHIIDKICAGTKTFIGKEQKLSAVFPNNGKQVSGIRKLKVNVVNINHDEIKSMVITTKGRCSS